MARNYSNIKYETFLQANEAAKRRAKNEGVGQAKYAVYPHWDDKGIKTWRISTQGIYLYRWKKNRCNQPVGLTIEARFQKRVTSFRSPVSRAGHD